MAPREPLISARERLVIGEFGEGALSPDSPGSTSEPPGPGSPGAPPPVMGRTGRRIRMMPLASGGVGERNPPEDARAALGTRNGPLAAGPPPRMDCPSRAAPTHACF